jgi:hypothetical protein
MFLIYYFSSLVAKTKKSIRKNETDLSSGSAFKRKTLFLNKMFFSSSYLLLILLIQLRLVFRNVGVVVVVASVPPILSPTAALEEQWKESTNLKGWLHPFDVCLLADTRNVSSDIIIKDCEDKLSKNENIKSVPPTRCRIGNTWPSKSTFCDSSDIPFANRRHFRTVYNGYDNPNDFALKDFFFHLTKKKGMLLLIGDSVMQQFFNALACELEREKVWTNPDNFKNTDEVQYISLDQVSAATSADSSSTKSAIKFLPIYHFVDGRYDRRKEASFNLLMDTLVDIIKNYPTLYIMCNMGLHYIDNPAPGFAKQDYFNQMEKLLVYLHKFRQTHSSTHDIQIIWRETTAQHFMTPNGFWPGIKYIRNMVLKCAPLEDVSPQSDWRNRAIEKIIQDHSLGSSIHLLRYYNITAPLWSEHPNGHMKDCTHFCWTPMLYQPIFHYLRNLILKN